MYKVIVILIPAVSSNIHMLHGFEKTWVRQHHSKESAIRVYKSLSIGTEFGMWKIKYVDQIIMV